MDVKGIRIKDLKENGVIAVKLSDILELINDGFLFYWRILLSDIIPNPGEEKFIVDLEKQIESSKKGVSINWVDLKSLSNITFQEIDITVIGNRDKTSFKQYKQYKDIYSICDIVIEMIDSTFWEVRSKDCTLIKKLAAKFKEIELLNPDSENN